MRECLNIYRMNADTVCKNWIKGGCIHSKSCKHGSHFIEFRIELNAPVPINSLSILKVMRLSECHTMIYSLHRGY